jgi:hypothetical protein
MIRHWLGYREVDSFQRKAEIVEEENGRNEVATFPTWNLLLEDKNVEFSEVKNVIVEHLEELTLDFDHYIPEDVTKYSWVCCPIDTDAVDLADEISNTTGLQEQLINIQNDETLHYNFQKQTELLSAFWIKVSK